MSLINIHWLSSSPRQNLIRVWKTLTLHRFFPVASSVATTKLSPPSPVAEYRIPLATIGGTSLGATRLAIALIAQNAQHTRTPTICRFMGFNLRWNARPRGDYRANGSTDENRRLHVLTAVNEWYGDLSPTIRRFRLVGATVSNRGGDGSVSMSCKRCPPPKARRSFPPKSPFIYPARARLIFFYFRCFSSV